jgi:hypothetical protein
MTSVAQEEIRQLPAHVQECSIIYLPQVRVEPLFD